MKNPQLFNYLCKQPFSVQKNKGLHTSILFANICLKKKFC